MHRFTRVMLFALTVTALPLAAQEIRPIQRGPERSGFWWGVGAGLGRAEIDCSYCTADAEGYPMLQLSGGVALSKGFAVGVQAAGGAKHDAYNGPSDNTATFGDLNVSVYWYPISDGNLWLQGGVSRVLWRVTKDPVDSNTYHAVANGLTGGIGYDIPLGRRASITPSIRAVWGREGDLINEDTDTSAPVSWKTTLMTAGVSITWH